MATDNCTRQGATVKATVTKVCRHRDQTGKDLMLLSLSDGSLAALYLTNDMASAVLAAMGGSSLSINGVPLCDLQATHAAAVRAAAASAQTQTVRIVEMPPAVVSLEHDANGRIAGARRRDATA